MTCTPRTRRTIAVLCCALVIFATFVPGAASAFITATLVPLWLVVPAVVVTVLRRRALKSHAQPLALLSAADFRGPPLTASFA